MNLDPAPRLKKSVFLAIDAGLLITAFVIVYFAKNPYAPLPFVSAVLCVVTAAIIGFVPFLYEYHADNRDYVEAERRRVTEQVQRLQAAADSLGRAASQIKAVEESVHKTAHAAENLPYRMQEKLAEFNEALATKENEENETLERELDELRAANADNLKAVADKIAKAANEWSGLETASRKQLAAAQDATTRLAGDVQAALAQIDSRIAALQKAAASVPTTITVVTPVAAAYDRRSESQPEPVAEKPAAAAPVETTPPPAEVKASASDLSATAEVPAKESAPIEPTVESAPVPEASVPAPIASAVEGIIESVTLTEAPAKTAEEPKPRKPRAPRKSKPEDTLAAMSAEPSVETPAKADLSTEASAQAEPAPTENTGSAAAAPADEPAAMVEDSPAKAESSTSSDGATRLLVTAYIGIGNKLFIRGEGPGLSWEKGVPMQFVSIGKWGWASHDASAPVRCKLYKNDETAALSGEVTLEPGKHVELSALF